MYRFPLWLALAGAVLPVVTLLEGFLPVLWVIPFKATARDWDQLVYFWMTSARYSVLAGVAVGLIAILFAVLCHGRANSLCAARFAPNLFWCSLVALLLIAFNAVLFVIVVKTTGWVSLRGSSEWVFLAPLVSAGVLNFVGVLWAIARTIGSDDVLTPRVLLSQIRRSARLEGNL